MEGGVWVVEVWSKIVWCVCVCMCVCVCVCVCDYEVSCETLFLV